MTNTMTDAIRDLTADDLDNVSGGGRGSAPPPPPVDMVVNGSANSPGGNTLGSSQVHSPLQRA